MRIVSFRSLASNSDAEISKSKLVIILESFVLYSSSVYLYAANDPIIEASSGLKFGPFNLGYPKLRE